MTSQEAQISSIDLAENSSETSPNEKLNENTPNGLSEERKAEIQMEMEKLEDEIATLKQALNRKETQLAALRTEIGMTRWSRIQNSQAVNKSKQALADAGQKTSSALKSFGAATASKWTEIKESEKMQSVSEKFWATTGAVKAKIYGGGNNQQQVEDKPRENVDTAPAAMSNNTS